MGTSKMLLSWASKVLLLYKKKGTPTVTFCSIFK